MERSFSSETESNFQDSEIALQPITSNLFSSQVKSDISFENTTTPI